MINGYHEESHHEVFNHILFQSKQNRIDQSIESMLEDDNQKLRQSTMNLLMNDANETFRAIPNEDSFHPTEISYKYDQAECYQPQSLDSMPIIRMEVSLSVSQLTICEIFTRLCAKKGYEIIDNDGEQIVAIKKRGLSLKDYILFCISWERKYEKLFSCVKMIIKTNKFISKRKIILRGLFGEINVLKLFLDQMQEEMEFYNIRKTRTTRSFFSDLKSSQTLKSTKILQKYTLAKEEIVNTRDNLEFPATSYNIEANSFNGFQKILSSDESNIGKKISSFIKEFLTNYKSIKEAAELLPQPMESIFTTINEAVEQLPREFNNLKNMISFCRVSIEEYLFDQLYTHLFEIYKEKYNEISKQYNQQSEEILMHYESDPIKIMKYLDLNKDYWLIDSSYFDDNNQSMSNDNDISRPYNDSIIELTKLNHMKTPREKLNVLLMMHNLMKSSVVDFHKGKLELNSMDDELPIIIYIVLNAQIKDIEAEFAYIEDFINLDPSMENEKKLLTNLRVCLKKNA